MALPNYKQIGMNMPSATSHMMSPGPAGFNILKERLRPSGGSGDRGKDNSSPFMHSTHGNPAFTPQKMGKGGVVVDPRVPKPPKPPEKPLMPFMRYSRKVWDQVKTANPELKLWEVSKIIAQMWKDAPENERQEFIDEYEAEKVQYIEALKVHHATPEYGTWNRYHVNRLKAGVDSEEPPQRSSSKSQQERRLDIQPAEDDEDQDDGYTFKHVAYARFLRNHRLINEIFSDAVVPDVRSVVTTQRMQVLKRQVQSLTMHQMKLETELQQIEEKFEAKKRKFVDSSDQFQEELKKHCKPAVDDDTFKKMVERQFEAMRRERLRQLEEPKVSAPKPEEVLSQPVAPSAPNTTTIQSNEVDKPDSSEALQPMEAEPVHDHVEKKSDSMDDGNLAPVAPVPVPADAVSSPNSTAETETSGAENSSENMDIEPTETTTSSHPPSSHAIATNNPSSDITAHPPYVTPSPPVPVAAPTPSSTPLTSNPHTSPPASVQIAPGAPAMGTPSVPAVNSNPSLAPAPPSTTTTTHHHQPPPPSAQPHVPIVGQPPYPGPGYVGHPPPQGAPYYPPYQYPPYPPHQHYPPQPPSHYMAPRPPGMHYPEHGHYAPPTGPSAGPPPASHEHTPVNSVAQHVPAQHAPIVGDAPPAPSTQAPIPSSHPEEGDENSKKEEDATKEGATA